MKKFRLLNIFWFRNLFEFPTECFFCSLTRILQKQNLVIIFVDRIRRDQKVSLVVVQILERSLKLWLRNPSPPVKISLKVSRVKNQRNKIYLWLKKFQINKKSLWNMIRETMEIYTHLIWNRLGRYRLSTHSTTNQKYYPFSILLINQKFWKFLKILSFW